jgi:hypothetical protein
MHFDTMMRPTMLCKKTAYSTFVLVNEFKI